MLLHHRTARPNIRGFTLIELLVVIAIIGVLASVILASLQSAAAKARDAARFAELNQFVNALELYYADHGAYPGTADTWYQNNCTAAADPYEADYTTINPLFSGSFSLPPDPLPSYGCMWYIPYPTPDYAVNGSYKYVILFVPENQATAVNGPDCYWNEGDVTGRVFYCYGAN